MSDNARLIATHVHLSRAKTAEDEPLEAGRRQAARQILGANAQLLAEKPLPDGRSEPQCLLRGLRPYPQIACSHWHFSEDDHGGSEMVQCEAAEAVEPAGAHLDDPASGLPRRDAPFPVSLLARVTDVRDVAVRRDRAKCSRPR